MAIQLNDIINDGSAQFLVVRTATTKDINDVRNEIDAVNTKLESTIFDNAGAHNSIYRGKDLTAEFEYGKVSTSISNGTFKDIFPGDYIKKTITVNGNTYTNAKWLVADCNYFIGSGDNEVIKNHVVMVSELNLGVGKMNDTDTSAGGYVGTKMWREIIPLYSTAITTAFGSNHVLTHAELLSDNTSTTQAAATERGTRIGAASSSSRNDVVANLLNEAMLLGHTPYSSSGYDTEDCNTQLSIFRHNKRQTFVRGKNTWLRSIYNSNNFVMSGYDGNIRYNAASSEQGIRVYFLLT